MSVGVIAIRISVRTCASVRLFALRADGLPALDGARTGWRQGWEGAELVGDGHFPPLSAGRRKIPLFTKRSSVILECMEFTRYRFCEQFFTEDVLMQVPVIGQLAQHFVDVRIQLAPEVAASNAHVV